ncbi:type I polyketide synthase [Desulforegula conservatrix]|uniref:type I polyketide synthase n=1 Tax=Desulforegula conservatrix TaxID=153026 RepID=UPI0018DCCC36|nr:type I polyketide synthase [Desulforegula conservatrix]
MIRRILDSRLPFMAYPPTRVFDLNFFKSVHEAGGLPVLDTEFFQNDEILQYAEMLGNACILFGVRIPATNSELIKRLYSKRHDYLDALIIYGLYKDELKNYEPASRSFKIILEVRDININDTLETIAPDAIILKGTESGGLVSGYTGYVLMQWYLQNTNYPVFMHGGVGMHNAAGMFCAGVSGVVLDSQLYLAAEAPVSANFRKLFETMEELDTILVEGPNGVKFRFFAKLGTSIAHDLKKKESHFALSNKRDDNEADVFFGTIKNSCCALDNKDANAVQSLFYLGQDASFARIFASYGKTIKEIITAFFRNISDHIADLGSYDPISENSELAREHGTKYPIIQGPMANISESADFAEKIFKAGGLPFFAMGNLPTHIADPVLKNASEISIPYGAGLIGIEVFNKSLGSHLDLVKKYKSPFALFAAGSPFQAADLEKNGTKTYLHTPSTMILENAIQNGCSRYILEGTEAGGHVGSLASLVLWELSVDRLARMSNAEASGKTLIFAGGISTSSGSHFISGMTAFLAKKGVKIGIQVGSAYLFTNEIIETKGMTQRYQKEILDKESTLVIGKTVGLPSRTVASPFSLKMLDREHERISGGMPLNDRKKAFEHDNMGSLLIGAKGFVPDFKNDPSQYVWFNEDEIYDRGNFCVGDSLAFFKEVTTIQEIHDRYFATKDILAKNLDRLEILTRPDHEINDEIAITGMGCVFPDAFSPEELWQNILEKKSSIRPVPENRLDNSLYYTDDKSDENKTYSNIAGTVEKFSFMHSDFGLDEEQSSKISRSQQFILTAAKQAAHSAGYTRERSLPLNTAVIIASCLGNELTNDLQLKYYTPEIRFEMEKIPEFQALSDEHKTVLLENLKNGLAKNHKNEPPDTAVLNIEASRIASALNVEGPNYVVDAACATSFAAIDCGIRELLSGSCDAVVTGGLNTNLSPEAFIGFSRMGALSGQGSWPFDERANGFVLGEGAGAFVLKRMRDALRDGDNILAIIKGMGASSDGKGKAIAAPNPKGQELALKRCFENAKTPITPEEIGYIEAHGTSTVMGDAAEIETLKAFYGSGKSIGISSIKSQIGHLLGGAGAAGLAKAILSINNKTLPPNADFRKASGTEINDKSGLFIIKDAQPWDISEGKTRKAAVSSYGFGGINYHCVIEEYTKTYKQVERRIFPDPSWDPNEDRIIVTGLGAVLPGAASIEAFWKKLLEGDSAITETPELRFSADAYASDKDKEYGIPKVKAGVVPDFKFNNVKYKIPPMSAASVDRAQLFGLTAADQAISSSGLSKVLDFGNKVNVILGTISGNHYVENVLRVRLPFIRRIIAETEEINPETAGIIADKIVEVFKKRLPRLSEDTTPGLLSNIVSGRIANFFGCNGANFIIDAACASSALAIRASVMGLLAKTSDFVITGGVDTNLYPTMMMVFKRLGLLSEKDTHVFDEKGSGVVLSEGAAIQILTTYKKAKELGMPVLGELRSIEMKSKAGDNMFSPSASLFNQVIETAHEKAGSSRDEIDHLDVFGFGHYLLDQIEHRSVKAMFRKTTSYGNIKPEFGYYKAANPAVALTRMILMNSNRTVLPFNSFDPESSMTKKTSHIQASPEQRDLKDSKRPVFAANIFGFGGNHGHMVAGSIPAWMANEKAVSLPAAKETSAPSFTLMRKNGVAVLLSGQGAQYKGMLKELYATESGIRTMLDKAESIFRNERGYSLLSMMFEGSSGAIDSKDLNSTENTQPAVFLASAAIFTELEKKGLIADAFIGHSIGEYTALFTSGMLDFETAFKLVLKRSSLMKKASEEVPGEIMAVFKGSEEVGAIINESGIRDIYIANKNSRKQTVVSGSKAGMADFSILLSSKGILYRKLNLSGAFHTPLFASAASGMTEAFREISFKKAYCGRIISNVTARPYPEDHEEIKNLLVSQIISPVEFIKSVEHLYEAGIRNFVEAGSGKILTNLVNDMDLEGITCINTIDSKSGDSRSFENAMALLSEKGFISTTALKTVDSNNHAQKINIKPDDDTEFDDFLKENHDLIREKLFNEYKNKKRDARLEAYDQFGFYTGSISIAGVSIGLPGTAKHVFESDNFDRLLSGQNFIEALTDTEKDKMLDKNITKLVKQSDGNAKFQEITSPEEVIQLAGKLGFFDLKDEYGIEAEYDITIALSIAAGIEALKDAGIPLVMNYRETAAGAMIPEGLALPSEMQNTTGVILTSLFPGWDTLITEVREYYRQKFFVKPYQEMEKVYYFLMENLSDPDIKSKITEWFFGVWDKQIKGKDKYVFKRDFPANITPLGSAHFARIIKAKGPNIQMSGACASTTQAVCVAEDWIRAGRCERVVIIGGEAATSKNQGPWIGSGFLSLGAASIKKSVQEAAKPFDEDRNGTILGAGATSLIVERTDRIKHRGMNGQAEILGTRIGNSAFHTTGIDVKHLAGEMVAFVNQFEKRHNLEKSKYVEKTVFMSHETFTPARGGSADAEIEALRASYGNLAEKITITNTKGYTGHTLGAAIEDAVMVKALQTGKVPPVANLKKIPANFADLKFSKGEKSDFEYGIHLSAGFGSHFAFLFIKKTKENSAIGNPVYSEWLKKISGADNPVIREINKTLCLEAPAPVSANKKAGTIQESPKKDPEKALPLQKVPAAATASFNTNKIIKSIIAEQTGYSDDMLGDDLDLEADLGIDTVKQVEIFGKITASFDVEMPEGANLRELNTISGIAAFISKLLPEPAKTTPAEPEKKNISLNVKEEIRKIIAEQTGYSEDMLGDDLDLEADLGIDTVKQVEIFGRITAAFDVEMPEGANLRELNTISGIAAFIGKLLPEPVKKTSSEPEKKNISINAKEKVRKIISDQTGYSEDMLEYGLDLEADLGIDTVKQVEIFGKITAAFGVEIPEGANLRELNTISSIADFIEGLIPYSSITETLSVPEPSPSIKTDKVKYKPETAETIKKIISEHTGYSMIMLNDEYDLEADLGIDTLKLVDVFSLVTNHFGIDISEEVDIREMKSIANIAAFIDSGKTGSASIKKSISDISNGAFMRSIESDSKIYRFTVGTAKAQSPEKEAFSIKGQTLLVSLDNIGLSSQIIPVLKSKGANIITIGPDSSAEIGADFENPEKTAEIFSKLAKERPEISGLIHLYAVSRHDGGNIGEGNNDGQILSIFNAVKAFAQNQEKQLKLIAMPAFNSVIFHENKSDAVINPVSAGLSGFLKTVAREMPETRVKVVDFAEATSGSDSAMDYVAERFVSEILSEDSRVETGYIKDQKFIPVLKNEKAPQGNHLLGKGSAVLVTGGAGGITFEILKSVVSENKPSESNLKLIITGRSDLKKIDKEIDSAKPSELLSIMKKRMPGEKPVAVKKAVERISRIIKTRDNIEELKKLGADVVYYSADATDFEAVQKVAESHPEINGIIHAAGVEESQPILKKTEESFSRVFDTKIKGFKNISKSFEKHDLKFIIGFSSVTARFGNAGQCDYTAANDMLGKLIIQEKIKRPELIVKIMDWTAWEGAGMATDETVRKVLTSRGLTFLPLKEGIRHFKAEIAHENSGEVVFTGMDRAFDPDGLISDTENESEPGSEETYFLDSIISENENETVFGRCLDLNKDLFLLDHSMADTPVFLGATGIETMAEAACLVSGNGMILREMSDFAIPYGIKILKKRPVDLEITSIKKADDQVLCRIASKVISPSGHVTKEHYKGTFIFSDSSPEDEYIEFPNLPSIAHEGELGQIIYQPSRLFMDGLFRTINSIRGFDGETLVTSISDTSEKPFFKGITDLDFMTPVVLVDAMFQTGGLFNMMSTDELVLPFGIKKMTFFDMPGRYEECVCITRKIESNKKTDTFELTLTDSDGRVFIKIQGFEMVKIGKIDARQSIRGLFNSSSEKKAS